MTQQQRKNLEFLRLASISGPPIGNSGDNYLATQPLCPLQLILLSIGSEVFDLGGVRKSS